MRNLFIKYTGELMTVAKNTVSTKVGAMLLATVLAVSCTSFDDASPYDGDLATLEIASVYPAGYASAEAIEVKATELTNGNYYVAKTDDKGCATFRIPRGAYRITLAEQRGEEIFNGTIEEVRLTSSGKKAVKLELPVFLSISGKIVIKEIYCGSCLKTPHDGKVRNDQYVILHNNDSRTQYLDGLCFGTIAPYTSNSTNNWVKTGSDGQLVFQEFAPIIECVWQFQGTGTDFPLAPGEDAVIAIRGAVDFTQDFPLSVNLNQPDYFATFSRLHFDNENNYLTPGDKIRPERILRMLKKTGVSSGYFISEQSPAIVIFRPEEGFDFEAYLNDDSQCVATDPAGSTKCVKVPWEWILDGVEVFYSTNNHKRLKPEVDAGAFLFSALYQGHTIHRKLDEKATAAAGHEIYVDTNNSSDDFYERPTQSLHR
ncbi:MAG: DUF4876 domain-containing protein [Alistipes senegalensis]|nr:DUF4876 domain-containing protein [Bacteroides cellulosilyticus]MCM1352853.1 DUF4876 domain-containing protein [Alistipes senegalensis]